MDVQALFDRGTDGIYLRVHAQPGARRAGIRGMHGDALRIAVREAAQDGRANAALIAVLAEALGVPRQALRLTAGHQGRRKRVFISGDPDALAAKLRALLARGD